MSAAVYIVTAYDPAAGGGAIVLRFVSAAAARGAAAGLIAEGCEDVTLEVAE